MTPSSVWFYDRNDHYDQHVARLRPCSLDGQANQAQHDNLQSLLGISSVPSPDGGYGGVMPLYAPLFGNLRESSYFHRFPGKNSLEDCKNRSGLSETVCSNCSMCWCSSPPSAPRFFLDNKGLNFLKRMAPVFCRIFRRLQIIQKS